MMGNSMKRGRSVAAVVASAIGATVLGLGAPGRAEPPPVPCASRAWPASRATSIRAIKRRLDRTPRALIVQMAWGEMRRANQRDSVAAPLLQYLAGTEARPVLRGYWKTLSMTMARGALPGQTLKSWPTRAPASATKFTLGQLCSMYERAAR